MGASPSQSLRSALKTKTTPPKRTPSKSMGIHVQLSPIPPETVPLHEPDNDPMLLECNGNIFGFLLHLHNEIKIIGRPTLLSPEEPLDEEESATRLMSKPSPSMTMSSKASATVMERLLGSDEIKDEIVLAIDGVIQDYWTKGIRIRELGVNYYKIKLKGSPWWADGKDAFYTKLLIAKIFEELISLGWVIKCCVDSSIKDSDKNACFFERCYPRTVKLPALSFNEVDRIRLVNGSDEFRQSFDAALETRVTVLKRGPYGIAYEWKLKGSPWKYGQWQNKALGVYLIQILDELDYVVLVSAETSSKYVPGPEHAASYALDASAWYLLKKEDKTALDMLGLEAMERDAKEREAKAALEAKRLAEEMAKALAAERMAAAVADAERREAERAARERAEAEKRERELAQRAEAERLAAEKAAAERAKKEAAEKAEAERLAAERAEAERLAAEKAAAERAKKEAAEKAEAERLAAEKAEAERLAAEKAEAERLAAKKAEADRLAG